MRQLSGKHMRRMVRSTAVLTALALVVAGCGDDDDDVASDSSTTTPSSETSAGGDTSSSTETSEAATEITFDFGVTEDTIRVGLNADLSGIFVSLVTDIVEAQNVYWDQVNENGGIGGKMIETVVLDNAYDVPTHLENYEQMRAEDDTGVAIISQSTGSPHTAAIAQQLVEDNLIAIPLTWYSGWADPDIGANVYETYTNYCYEAMNGVAFLADRIEQEEGRPARVAVISFPGEYGQDGAAGAKMAIEALGLELVYNGEGAVVPGADQTPVISELVSSGADIVWATINPSALGEIMGGAAAQGFTPTWSGNAPTYSFKLLATDLAPLLDELYFPSTYIVTWGADVPGMQGWMDAMVAARPDLPISDTYVLGWTEAMVTEAILRQAADNGDMTRAGIVAAAAEVTVDFQGLAPDQAWSGDPNEYIVRESYIYDVTLDTFDVGALSVGGSTGQTLLEGPYVADITADAVWEGPCFTA